MAAQGFRPAYPIRWGEITALTQWLIPALAGAAAGILSGFGVGGGTLLLIWLTAFAGVEQTQAQSINLLYFIPAALLALPSHIKNGYIVRQAAIPAICAGLLFSAAAAWMATAVDVSLLRKLFGFFLLYVGCSELIKSGKPPRE